MVKKDLTQEEMVLGYLKKHKNGMTSKDAYELFGIMQMPKRILTLRRMGYEIESTPKQGLNRFGKKVNFVVYTLEGEER